MTTAVFLPPVLAADEITTLLGLDLETALRRFGTPAEVFTVRGEEEWQDDVVFYYPNHLYLFWFQNRVWQVRVDQNYEKPIFELQMGDTREGVLAVLGKPLAEVDGSLIYHREDFDYPLRLRFFFEQDQLVDAYVYRGDF